MTDDLFDTDVSSTWPRPVCMIPACGCSGYAHDSEDPDDEFDQHELAVAESIMPPYWEFES